MAGKSDSEKLWTTIGAVASVLAILAFLGIATFQDLTDFLSKGGDDGSADPETSTMAPTEDPPPDDPIDIDDPVDEPSTEPSTEPEDDIVSAGVGDCVYGSSDSADDWDILRCNVDTFVVLERIDYAAGIDQCSSSDELDLAETFYGYDLTLCLSYQWTQGDIGHAPIDTCLYKSGDGDTASFSYVSCDSANVVVTGRTGTYGDQSFCGGDASAWDGNTEFDLAYTVCYTWYY